MDRKKLVATLETVGRAIERNNAVPIYEFYCFTGDTVYAWNDVLGITAPCKVSTPFAVNGPVLLGLLTKTKSDKIEFEVSGDQLKVLADKAEYLIPIKSADEFQWKEPSVKAQPLDVDLIKGIEYCLPTTSDNLALEAFCRVYIGSKGGKIVVYSLDGDALTKYVTTIDGISDVCLSKAFCEAVVKTGGGNIFIGKEWVYSAFEDYKVYGRNLGSSTFDYEDYIGKIIEGPMPDTVAFPLKLDDALSRARVVADIETSPTSLIVDNNELILLTETPFGEFLDTMKLKHPDIEVQVSSALFQTNMSGCTSFKVLDKCCLFKGEQLIRLVSNL